MTETKSRSVLKSLSWRAIAFLVTASIVFVITKEAVLSFSVGIVDSMVKVFAYYYHERIWTSVPLGKITHPLADLNVTKELAHEHKVIVRRKLQELGYLDN